MMNASPVEILASVFFGLAVLHTFSVKRFAHWAHLSPPGSIKENILHFLAETEVVFGLWAAALFLAVAAMNGTFKDAVSYIESLKLFADEDTSPIGSLVGPLMRTVVAITFFSCFIEQGSQAVAPTQRLSVSLRSSWVIAELD